MTENSIKGNYSSINNYSTVINETAVIHQIFKQELNHLLSTFMKLTSFKELSEKIIDVCTDPEAKCMATTLDRALNDLVENQEHNPSNSFQMDYYNLERLRTAVRELADMDITEVEKGGQSC